MRSTCWGRTTELDPYSPSPKSIKFWVGEDGQLHTCHRMQWDISDRGPPPKRVHRGRPSFGSTSELQADYGGAEYDYEIQHVDEDRPVYTGATHRKHGGEVVEEVVDVNLDKEIHLNGFSCYNSCRGGWYDGYDVNSKNKDGICTKTMPCKVCGHQMPASMTIREFRKMIAERDAERERTGFKFWFQKEEGK